MIKLGDCVRCVNSFNSDLIDGNIYKVIGMAGSDGESVIAVNGLIGFYSAFRFRKVNTFIENNIRLEKNIDVNKIAKELKIKIENKSIKGENCSEAYTDAKLFYIDIPNHFQNVTISDQLCKLHEETNEVKEALINQDNDNFIEECHDVIQAILGLIELKGLKKEFKEGFEKHKNKMIDRGYELEEI